ncbi:MAG: hypothetical protein LBG10_04190, partial [Treponema sp.]|nr:hypothetical protein [Treponema sp.]
MTHRGKNKVNLLLVPLLLIPLAGLLLLSQTAEEDIAVYVTNSGNRYHRDNCRSLRRSRIAVTLEDAVKSGYGPCSICNPPVLSAGVSGPAETPDSGGELYRVNTAGLAASAAADTSRMVRAEVVGHVDGDTVRVRISSPPAG